MATGNSAPAWRTAAVAICLLPVVVPLALLCLPLLCLAVAVARFRRRRLRRAAKKTSGCFFGGEQPSTETEEDGEGAWRRVALLHKYLEDQMELIGGSAEAEKGDDAMAAQAKKASAPIGDGHLSLAKLGDQD